MKSQKVKEKFVELRAKGLSYDKISQQIGVSKPTLISWSKELEVEIFNLSAIEKEKLQKMLRVSKEYRVKLLSSQLNMVLFELGKRDLSTINTAKLLELSLRYLSELKSEDENLLFRQKFSPLDDLVTHGKTIEWEG